MDTTTTAIETPAEKKAAAARLWALLVAVYEAISNLVRRLLGLATSTASELKGDAIAAARTARRGMEVAGHVVGTGLEGPARVLDATAGAVGAVGSTLGALLPHAPVTPAAVARGAMARDDRRQSVATAIPADVAQAHAPAPVLTTESLVKAHAYAALDRTGRKSEGLIPLDARHTAWIASMTLGEKLSVAAATPEAIARHINATTASERILGVSAVPSAAQHVVGRERIDSAMAILGALPSRPDLSPNDAFRALGVGLHDEPEEDEPVARYGR